jgi:hypothetical protein
MAEYFTSTGRRPDLEAMEVNPPEGYIGNELIPTFQVMDKTGTVYYNAVTADSAAQTGRSTTAAPTAETVANTSTTFTCAEVVDRAVITPDEAKSMGGIEKADRVGTIVAKRNVLNAIETAVRVKVLGTAGAADATFDPGKCTLQVQTALETVRRYEGLRVMSGSSIVMKGIVRSLLADNTMGPVFARLVSGTNPATAASGLNLKVWADALAIWFGVDKVLMGCDAVWNPAATPGRFAVTVVDNSGDPLSHKWKPVYAKNFLYLPDGNQPFEVRSYANEDTLTNNYTALAWYNVVELNSAATYVFDGVITA